MSRAEPDAKLDDPDWSAIDPVSATFRDAEIEGAFQRHLALDGAMYMRFTFFAGLALWILFSALDWLTLGDEAIIALWIRLGFALPIAAVFAALAANKRFHRYIQSLTFALCVLGGSAISVMTVAISPPFNLYYSTGILLIFVGLGFMFRAKFFVSLAAVLTVCAVHAVLTVVFQPISASEWLIVGFFQFACATYVLFSRYVQEMQGRRSYTRQLLVRQYARQTTELLEEAKAAEEAKRKFLSIISHELRTPLNSIIGFSDIIKNESMGPIGQDQYLGFAEAINDGGRSLLKTVNDIIHFSRAEAGKLELNAARTALRQLLHGCIQQAAPTKPNDPKAPTIELAIDAEISSAVVVVDHRLFQHAVGHVLENAINFSPDGGVVELKAALSGRDIVISVSDQGPGIDEDALHRVFNPFEQIDDPMTRNRDGVGIGLPFAKRIIELHGGAIEVGRSEAGGAEVSMRIPGERIAAGEEERADRARKTA